MKTQQGKPYREGEVTRSKPSRLQKYLSLPISTYVLQYSVVDPTILEDGSKGFDYIYKFHNRQRVYDKLAGLGHLINLTKMKDRMPTIDTVYAIAAGTGNNKVFGHICARAPDMYRKTTSDVIINVMRMAIFNKHLHMTEVLATHVHPNLWIETIYWSITSALSAGNYGVLGVFKKYYDQDRIAQMIYVSFDKNYPVNMKLIAKALGTSIEKVQDRLARHMYIYNLGGDYWTDTYKLFDKMPEILVETWRVMLKTTLNDVSMVHIRKALGDRDGRVPQFHNPVYMDTRNN